MAYLCDSNIFVRRTDAGDPLRGVVFTALRKLKGRGETLCFTPQVAAEFGNVATRPTEARGGIGLSPDETERRVCLIEKHLRLLPGVANLLTVNTQDFTRYGGIIATHPKDV